ncbi:MAG: NTP/NDP exchange transporter [Verrucomicrobia bacterium]|nr:NTP/NDP exchange transporter [Verrucomicrobiota bacterium]
MQHTEKHPAFGKWRNRLWPFHHHEMKKLLPLVLMKFLVSVIYCILFCLKETITVTSKGSGAEAITVLKSVVVLPAAFIAALCYSRMSNILKKTTLFYATTGSFLVILFLYAFALYPNADFLTPTQSADWLTSLVGETNAHWVSIYRNWMHALFFVTAELWGSIMILVVFWGFANDITSVSEAKRSYNLYIAAGNLAPMFTGIAVTWVSTKLSIFAFAFTVKCLISFALIAGVLVIGMYTYVQKKVIGSSLPEAEPLTTQSNTKKEKLSFIQGMRHLLGSPYLLGIAVLVVGYGLCITLVEVAWKANLKLAFPDPAEYQAFTGVCQSMVGTFAFFISAFLGSSMLRRLGWRATAQMAPVVVGGSGLAFLLLCSSPSFNQFLSTTVGITPLLMLVYLGAFNNVASKIAKYSFFDPTKEMAFIPLTDAEKVKGKASIDIVGSRLGKSGASWIQVFLISFAGSGSVLSITHLLVPIVFLATSGWVYSVQSLHQKFSRKTREMEVASDVALT